MTGYPHMTTIAVGIPFSGRPLPYQQTLCYAGWCSQMPMNYNAQYFVTAGKPIDEARCYFATEAQRVGAKYLFQWDEDVAVPTHAIRQLIFHMEHHPDWALVGGVYCQKNEPECTCAPMIFRGQGQGPYWDWHAGEIFEVDSMGMGCSLIRVECFKDVEQPWFKTVQDNDAALDNIASGILWTEDIWFCERLKRTGKWKIFADGSLIMDHLDLATGKAYRLPKDSKPVKHLMTPHGTKHILDIGAGESRYQTDEGEVVTADIRESVNPDYRCDVRRLPFATESFDIVFSSHTLEHFDRGEVDAVLDEWVRVLKPDGELRLVLPNVAWAAAEIQKGNIDGNVLNVLYGQQSYAENYHKMCFTPEMLTAMLKQRKFTVHQLKLDGYNIYCSASRNGKPPKRKKK